MQQVQVQAESFTQLNLIEWNSSVQLSFLLVIINLAGEDGLAGQIYFIQDWDGMDLTWLL